MNYFFLNENTVHFSSISNTDKDTNTLIYVHYASTMIIPHPCVNKSYDIKIPGGTHKEIFKHMHTNLPIAESFLYSVTREQV